MSKQISDLSQFSNERLCDVVVAARHFNTMREEAILCMTELAARRGRGDDFNYEDYIEKQIKELPDFKIDIKKKVNLGLDLSLLKGIIR